MDNCKPLTALSPYRHLRAGNGTRTRDPNLGKVVLYQLSYSRAYPTCFGQVPGAHPVGDAPTALPPDRRTALMEARGIEPLTS